VLLSKPRIAGPLTLNLDQLLGSRPGLSMFSSCNFKIAQPEERWIGIDLVLEPLLVEA
jgi:hypothetical protein